MASKALYLKRVEPRLLHRLSRGARAIEVWKTTCIVTQFGRESDAQCSILVNPSNPELSGVSGFPYFPRGGPVPKQPPRISAHHIMGYVTEWGGMDVGSGMVFPVAVVDGMVHLYGGWKLQAECTLRRSLASDGKPCPVGTAVMTSAGGLADKHFDKIIHTTPPFYRHDDNPETRLRDCYQSALDKAFSTPPTAVFSTNRPRSTRVAIPLLGAGARGFPVDRAIDVAANALWQWLGKPSNHTERCEEMKEETVVKHQQVVALGLLETSIATDVIDKVREISKRSVAGD